MTAHPIDDPADAGPVAAAMSMLSRGDSGRRARLGQAVATAVMVHQVGRNVTRWVVAKRAAGRYQVAVYDNDALYRPVQQWVLAQMPERAQRALIARTERDGRPVPVGPGAIGPSRDRSLDLFFDGSRAQQVEIQGHKVLVVIEREGADAARTERDGGQTYSWRPSRVVFSCQDLAGKRAVIRFLEGLTEELATGGDPALHVLGRWGEWHAARLQARPLDSVVLAAGQLERIVADLSGFYAAEARYVELGIPWHRGYLFEGPPGTGKTSTVRALAGHLGVDVYHVPLADVRADADLPRVLSSVGQGLLLLEDVDVATAARDRDGSEAGGGLTTSGLLQALDGLITPHGLVTVMTTNRREVLDEALLRPGRADLIERMDYLSSEQLDRLLVRMCGTGATPGTRQVGVGLKLAPADVIEIVLRHLDDPAAVPAAVEREIDRRHFGLPYAAAVQGNHQ